MSEVKSSTTSPQTQLSCVGFIKLTRGFTAMVDASDLPGLTKHSWNSLITRSGNVYAVHRNLRMHRVITCPQKHEQVDHINGTSTDNRKSNLRIATNQQNAHNRFPRTAHSSQFKGVRRMRTDKGLPWRASIHFNGRNVHLGVFATEEEAAAAYDRGAKLYFGEFAKTNFV